MSTLVLLVNSSVQKSTRSEVMSADGFLVSWYWVVPRSRVSAFSWSRAVICNGGGWAERNRYVQRIWGSHIVLIAIWIKCTLASSNEYAAQKTPTFSLHCFISHWSWRDGSSHCLTITWPRRRSRVQPSSRVSVLLSSSCRRQSFFHNHVLYEEKGWIHKWLGRYVDDWYWKSWPNLRGGGMFQNMWLI